MRIQTIETIVTLIQIATYLAIITVMGSALSGSGFFESVQYQFTSLYFQYFN